MRRLCLLGGSALMLSGSTGLPPALATTVRDAAATSSSSTVEVAVRSADPLTDAAEGSDEPPIKPIAPVLPIAAPPQEPRVRSVSRGQASWYGPGFFGNRTANGEVFRPGTLTAAHRTLPFGTKVRVTNMRNGKSTVVRINDRGPFHGNRVIDLAHGAAHHLGLISSGVANVKLEVLQ